MWRRWCATLPFMGVLMACTVRGAENAADLTLVYPCKPATAPITIDGKLDSAEWGNAVEVSGFTVSGSNTLAPEQTLMRLSYDRENLYIAVTCLESNMKGLKTTNCTERDGQFWLDDSVEFFLNPSHDHESYWQFAATATGMGYDNSQGDSAWNSNWKVAATRGPDSWTMEAAVPFAEPWKTPAPGALWGFNLCRERQAGGKTNLYNWADVQRVFNTVTRYGHIAFVAADWQPMEATVAAAVREAGGKESRLFAQNGWWRAPKEGKPEYCPYIALLRGEDKGFVPLFTELKAIYEAKPQMPLRDDFQQLDASYLAVKAVIDAGAQLDAQTWTRNKTFLDGLQAKLDKIYWSVKLVILNETM